MSAIYSVPAVHKRLAPFLNDTLSLADVPTDRSPQEVKERAQKWYPSRAYYLALALLSALQVAVWAVAFGDVLALWINSSGEASRHTVIYTGLNLGVWVRRPTGDADSRSCCCSALSCVRQSRLRGPHS